MREAVVLETEVSAQKSARRQLVPLRGKTCDTKTVSGQFNTEKWQRQMESAKAACKESDF